MAFRRSPRRRARVWRGVAEDGVRVVAGARSALFLPFADLRLIVVDEEHEAAYKQDDGVAYHARDMAVVRARQEAAPSSWPRPRPPSKPARTPARALWRRGSKAASRGRDLPAIEAVDLRRDAPPRGNGSRRPSPGDAGEFRAQEQALLFLNLRAMRR